MKSRLWGVLLAALLACGEDERPHRSFRMGFANSAPRFDNLDLFVQSLGLWTQRADAAIISNEVPWAELVGGITPEEYVIANFVPLADYYRSKNLELWVYIDPQNGLDRSSDALDLQALGKSIADADIQQAFMRYAFVVDSILQPGHLGLALETNLIRDAAPADIYTGVRVAANNAAAVIRIKNASVKLSVSVQVDHAWGKLVGGTFSGVEQDFADFAFIDELGLSSYPYFGFGSPAELPDDYYSRLLAGHDVPVFVSEGGWTSANASVPGGASVNGTPELQAQYIARQSHLLNNAGAIAVFSLTFTDIDLDALPPDVPASIGYFAYLGLVDKDFQSKPALAEWDKVFALPLR
jgi:hypothetical protein